MTRTQPAPSEMAAFQQAPSAVVAGATGEVGEGITAHLLRQGWQVTALGRQQERLDGLTARLGAPALLRTVVAPRGQDWSAAAGGAGAVSLVVASLGGWFSGPPLVQLPRVDADRVVQDGLLGHLLALQALLPALEESTGGTYVMVNGAAALHPVPGLGIVSAVAAAQLMLARVADAESQRVAVRSLVVSTPVLSRSRPAGPAGWVSADDIGAAVLRLHADPGPEVVVPFPDTIA